MGRPGRAGLVVALLVGVGACFHDPLSGLAQGPRTLVVSRSALVLASGAGASVAASLRDGRGALVPIGDARWSTGDSTVVVVASDTAPIPDTYEARAEILARAPTGGVTTVTVSAGGLRASIPVGVLPGKLDPAFVHYAGAPHPDTLGFPAPIAFRAPDTLVLQTTGMLRFDTAWSSAYVSTAGGMATGYLLSKAPTRLAIVFVKPALGRVVVRQLLFVTGDSALGTIAMDSLVGDSVAVSRQRFTGDGAVVGDTMTLTAGSGQAFYTPTYGPWQTFGFDTASAAVLSRTATVARLLSPVTYTGVVTVNGVLALASGAANLQLGPITTTSQHSISAATFPGVIATRGRLLDTVTVYAGGGAAPLSPSVTVPATYPCSGCSYGAWIVFSSPDSLRFISPVGVDGPIRLGQVQVGYASLPMTTRATLVVSGDSTGEPNEPGNDSAAGATALAVRTDVFGALNGSTDTTDYYTFQVPATAHVALSAFEYPGNGAGDATKPRLYAFVCDSLIMGACGSETDLAQGAVLMPPGQAWLRVTLRTPTAGAVAYHLFVSVFPTSGAREARHRP